MRNRIHHSITTNLAEVAEQVETAERLFAVVQVILTEIVCCATT